MSEDDERFDEESADDEREAHLEEMESWFRERFEDPANRTPYESAEGGYIWIWGGPYDAEQELRAEFEGRVPEDAIMELVGKLQRESFEWAPTPRDEDYDEDLFAAVASNAAANKTLEEALGNVEELLAQPISERLRASYNRLLFANVITATETYLSDTFINRVTNDPELIQTYMEAEPEFARRKVRYADILKEALKVSTEVRKALLDTTWHNLTKVKALYRRVLNVKFGDVAELGRAIHIRHDVVHRNGRTRQGTLVEKSADDIRRLIAIVRNLAERIEITLDYGFEDETDQSPSDES